MTQIPTKELMTDLITQSLEHFAEHQGDPYRPVYEALYAHDAAYEGLFLLDSDEGLRANMMRTTLEIITTYLSDRDAAANRIIGARMSHIPYGIEADFDVFFEITRDVIAAACAQIWTPAHFEAWTQMLADFKAARL
ncbi:MAG: globin [Parvibaculales bacterium]